MTERSSAAARPRRLIVSIHDVSPRHESAIDQLQAQLEADGVTRLAMLVVPNFWGEAPIVAGSPFATRLRHWSSRGVEIFLHGSEHRDRSRHDRPMDRFKARHMTAGEGEFLGLTEWEAASLVTRDRALLEDMIGQPVTGFVAPAWLYGNGALDALQRADIGILEDHWRVWDAASGRTLSRSPVITWATRTPARKASSLVVAAIARSAPGPRVMRLAVHPGDVRSDRVRRSISKTVGVLRRRRVVSRYADLIVDERLTA